MVIERLDAAALLSIARTRSVYSMNFIFFSSIANTRFALQSNHDARLQ